jgi:hypothetical protein
MEHRQLGRTGVPSSAPPGVAATTRRHSNHPPAVDAGLNSIKPPTSTRPRVDEIVGMPLAGGKRDGVVLGTTLYMLMGDDPNRRGVSRRWIIEQVESSPRLSPRFQALVPEMERRSAAPAVSARMKTRRCAASSRSGASRTRTGDLPGCDPVVRPSETRFQSGILAIPEADTPRIRRAWPGFLGMGRALHPQTLWA